MNHFINFNSITVLIISLLVSLPVNAESDLDSAFRKEFAFMENQKQVLQQRLKEQKEEAQIAENKIALLIEKMEKKNVDTENKSERLNQRVLDAERMIESAESNVDALESTYEQANATLSDYGLASIKKDALFNSSSHQKKLSRIFDEAIQLNTKLSSVYKESAEYYLTDGKKIAGEIVHLGNIAAYGISKLASGSLAPAGQGEFKIWSQDAAATAESLSQGVMPARLKIFIFESSKTAIEMDKEKTLLTIVNSGGSIAWIIVLLGLLGALMLILRVVFLRRSGADAEALMLVIREDIVKGNLKNALTKCEYIKSAASRVVQATLRNADRQRDHIEDIISESILHESKYLNRHGAFIMVIAAVSPLLGLLGTVTGMIATFDVITQFGTGDPKLLSGGISTALVTTQLGLVVAIPTLMMGNLLSGWSNRIKDDMEKAALGVINLYEKNRFPIINEEAKAV